MYLCITEFAAKVEAARVCRLHDDSVIEVMPARYHNYASSDHGSKLGYSVEVNNGCDLSKAMPIQDEEFDLACHWVDLSNHRTITVRYGKLAVSFRPVLGTTFENAILF